MDFKIIALVGIMKSRFFVISCGFAMFAMFFGSGNLVYPLSVGRDCGGHYLLGALGFLATGVIIPFIGVFGMLLYDGSQQLFFSRLGKTVAFWLSFAALSLMGPFGVLARCITVAHGSVMDILPNVALWKFSIGMCVVVYIATMNNNRIIPLLGTLLTPFLLVSLAVISIAGLNCEFPPIESTVTGGAAFIEGVFTGYQTMDLLAAFFFATFVIRFLKKRIAESKQEESLVNLFTRASLVGGGLLAIVYVALVALAMVHASHLEGVAPEYLLAATVKKVLGPLASPIVCVAVVLACLTTAVVLASLFADFLRKDLCKDRLGRSQAMCVTLLIAFFISTLEFAGIARFIVPILEIIYPALIVLSALNIGHKLWGWTLVKTPVFLVLLVNGAWYIWG